jgi:hypothetical protein
MKPMWCVLDFLHGTSYLTMFTYGRMIPQIKTTKFVSTITKSICKSFHRSPSKIKHGPLLQDVWGYWTPHGLAMSTPWWCGKIFNCVKEYFSMSAEYIKEYIFWHGRNLSKYCFLHMESCSPLMINVHHSHSHAHGITSLLILGLFCHINKCVFLAPNM